MSKPTRLQSIDLLRGFVIVLMALDHVRDFFGPALFQPEDLAATSPGWFWTRWITHLCAPTFVLLAGSSAWLRGHAGGANTAALSRYLASRGAMLILLEISWINVSWQFALDIIVLQVIWAIGAGMLALALLVWLPRPLIALIAALLIVPHNLLDGIHSGNFLWKAWHEQGFIPLRGQFGVLVMYPLMPWIGLIAAGYALGPIFTWPVARRQRWLWCASALLLLAFIALRSFNTYGDPDPWSAQGRGAMFDLMSFMRVHKYPPSLLYLCITGSIGLALLAAFEKLPAIKPVLLFGRHPMFFYVLHVALAHLLGNLYFQLRFGGQANFNESGVTLPAGYIPSLWVVYLAWLVVLAIMFGLTLAWDQWRRGRPARLASTLTPESP